MWDNNRDSINDDFFKKCVSTIILFDSLDSMVGKASWYPKGGNKAQIVPYTISKLMTLLPKECDLDWQYIWQKQTLYPELAEELIRLAYCTHEFLMEQANGGIVRTISRTLAVWKNFQDYKYTLNENFVSTLASLKENKAVAQSANKTHKFNSLIDAELELFKLGVPYWMKVYNDLVKESVLSFGELEIIKGIASYMSKGNLPSAAQCKRLLKIIAKAEDKGYIMPN